MGFILLGVLFSMSCRDDSTLVVNPNDIPHGVYVYMDINTGVLDVTSLATTAFTATIVAPSNNVASLALEVSWVSGGVASDTVHLATYTSFPFDLSISAVQLGTALGVDYNTFLAGDRFNIISTATGTDGSVVTWDNLDQDAGTNPGEKQAFNYHFFVGCPVQVIADAAGTWNVTNDAFGYALASNVFTAGPGEDQLTIVDFYGYGADLIIDIDPVTGEVTVEEQWVADDFFSYTNGHVDGIGTSFLCANYISLELRHTVDYGGGRGSFGTYNLTFEK